MTTAHLEPSTVPPAEGQTIIRPLGIRPLGEQIIIRTIPPSLVGSIIIPDSAKGQNHMGEKGDFVHFVEAEVIAVGPGRRVKGDPDLFLELVDCLQRWHDVSHSAPFSDTCELLERAKNSLHGVIPPQVKPGDRILYHPAVQRFDRKIDPLLLGLVPEGDEEYFIIREESVLAILEQE